MPNAKAHQFAGAVSAGLFVVSIWALSMKGLLGPAAVLFGFDFSLLPVLGLAVVALFFSILPDMDIGTSKAHQYLTFGCCAIILLSFVWYTPFVGATATLFLLFMNILHHRGIVHSLVAGAVLSAPVFFAFGFLASGAAFVAYVSHLVCDKKVKLI